MIPVIIVTHNNANTIERTLIALRNMKFKYDTVRITIVDNFSRDGTKEILLKYSSSYNNIGIFKPVFLRKNIGFPKAVIIGLMLAKPEKYFALLNPDAIPTPYWLERLYETMEGDERIGIAQSLLVHLDGTVDSAGGFLNFLDYPKELKEPLDVRPYNVTYAKGAAVLIRVSAYRNAGGFDPRYFFYYDETDLCARIRKKGYKVVTVPTSIVFHVGLGSGIKCKDLFVLYYMERNRLFYMFKNEPFKLPIGLLTAILGAMKSNGIRGRIRWRAIKDFYKLTRGYKIEEPFNPC